MHRGCACHFILFLFAATSFAELPGTPGNEFVVAAAGDILVPAEVPARTRREGPDDRLVLREAGN